MGLALSFSPLVSTFAKDGAQVITGSFQQSLAELSLQRQRILDLWKNTKLVKLRLVVHHISGVNNLLAVVCVLSRQLGLCSRSIETDHEISGERHQLRVFHLEHVAHKSCSG